MRVSRRLPLAAATVVLALLVSVSPALAETHPFQFAFGSFANPNGIAVDESSGDVYVADLGTDTVSRFDASGSPAEFPVLKSNTLTGGATPAGSFSFPEASDTPAAIAVDNSASPSDPSRGDVYVMDAGNDVIDKFNASGEYLNQIAGPPGSLLGGVAVDSSGNLRVEVNTGFTETPPPIELFDDGSANAFVKRVEFHPPPEEQPYITEVRSASESGFAATGASGAAYAVLACGCVGKIGPNGENLGRVNGDSAAIAVADDPATGHLYVDDGSSVAEWDTGQMNGGAVAQSALSVSGSSGVFVSSFGGFLSAPTHQGGIAVNGATGSVYVSNPAAGDVDTFGSATPVALATTATGVTQTSATLEGTVNPRGAPITGCRFEYDTRHSNDLTIALLNMSHAVKCAQTPEQIGSGASVVGVSASVTGLLPGSLYRFRLVVENAAGAARGDGLFPTVSAGFGVSNFEAKFLNKDGSPDTQAGSHPYEMVTTLEYNTQIAHPPSGDRRWVALPDGNFKDVAVDLPPGFVGDPNATTKRCTVEELVPITDPQESACPVESELGELEAEFTERHGTVKPTHESKAVVNMVAPPGVALQLSAHILRPNAFVDVGVPAGGDSGARAVVTGAPITAPVYKTTLSIRGGVPIGSTKPFLTMPTACNGPLVSTIEADSYQEPDHWAKAKYETLNSAGTPGGMTGCAQLDFPPSIAVRPDTVNASSSSGLTAGVHISQKAALNPTGLAESGLRDLTVTLPAGVAINPADADGLEACSEGLASFTGFSEFNPDFEPGDKTATFEPELPNPLEPGRNFCPNGSKIGTVKIKTPLLPNPIEGAVYLASQEANPFGSLLAMYLVAEDPVSGTIGKQTGKVSLCESAGEALDGVACEAPGQIVTTFKNIPNLPLEDVELHFFGGERAPLRTPSHCGTYTTQASFIPWDGNGPVNTTSSFQVEHGPQGGPCPGPSLPFNTSANAGSTNIQAGAFTSFTLSAIRHDGEQNVQSLRATLPPGLSGRISNIAVCPEPQANEGTCPQSSEIGETTVTVGVGSHPFTVTGGKLYLTVPYNGTGGCTMDTPGCAPFGLTFEVPAKAGPFDLENTVKHHPACDCVVVRGKAEIDPITTALTITTDPPGSPHAIPTMLEGIPLEVQQVNGTTTRPNFQFNPTSCAKMGLVGNLFSTEGAQDTIELPYQVTNCAALKFEPKLSVSTSGKTSKANGASLTTKLTYPNVPQGTEADIAKVKVELPKQLPSRLTTLQKACTAKQFAVNPAGCPPESKIGHAVVHTPVLPVPLEGPAIFVSHGGEAFPSLTMVLQGDNVTIDLVGTTFISKAGITSTTFKTVPDQPFSTFELTLPQGKFSALTANGNLCSPTRTVLVKRKVSVRVRVHRKTVTRKVRETQPAPLAMPTEFVAQNGAVIHQSTKIAVTGCPKKKAKKASSHHGKGKAKKK